MGSVLEFQGPFHLVGGAELNVFNSEQVKLSGIYLFAVETAHAGMVVRYVGETGVSFEKRLKEHIIQLMGGNYRIADVESLRQMDERVLWDGLWRRGRTGMIQEFVDNYVELAPYIKTYVEAYRIFLSPLSIRDFNQRQRRLIESALAHHLRKQKNLMAPDIRYHLRKKGEESFSFEVTASGSVTGLPCRLAT